MILDVRAEISGLEAEFGNKSLREVLEHIEKEEYLIKEKGVIDTRINLSEATASIRAYRKYSEGGCQSCVNLGRETIDAQDASSGWYCEVSDPDYNKNARGSELGVRYSGFSPKVRKHYDNPCKKWKPRFSPPLDQLLEQEKATA